MGRRERSKSHYNMKNSKSFLPLIAAIAFVAFIVVGIVWAPGRTADNLSGTITGTVTMTSTTIETTPTLVVAASANLQSITLRNAGPAQVFCGFGAVTSTLYTGYVFDVPNTTSSLQERTIKDPTLLAKRMTCIGNGASSTLTILKWTN